MDTSSFLLNANIYVDSPCVYLIFDKNDKLLYIGKANSLGRRLSRHHVYNPSIHKVRFIFCESESEAYSLEEKLIAKYRPPKNRRSGRIGKNAYSEEQLTSLYIAAVDHE